MSPLANRPGRLKIGVVGAGRVGAVLAHALRGCGHEVTAVSGASAESRERIEVLLPGVPIVDPDDALTGNDLVLLTVPDDVLAEVVTGFAKLGLFAAGQIVVHTAGRYGMDVLAPATEQGAIPIAIHPAMTFTGTSVDLGRLEGAPFAITAGLAMLPIGQALVVEMGGEPIVLPGEAHEVYHAALAHGANHLVTLVSQARRILERAGVEETGKLFAPLLGAALEGALASGDYALTGPVRRGDVGTIAAHVAALARTNPEILPTYRELARATTSRAVELDFLSPAAAVQIVDVLEGSNARGEPAAPGTRVATTISELHGLLSRRHRAVVMTMGALHEGHLELVREAKRRAEEVVVTIFVNPLQFGEHEDLDAYPRTLDSDVEKLTALGVDVVFAPTAKEMYPHRRITLRAGEMGNVLEGAARPGHFDGMLTVVNKLLGITRPDLALFGQKDAQQLALIRAMVADLNLDVDIVAVPIVRDRDGLALSSRNAYLSADERASALIIPRTIRAGAEAAAAGAGPEGTLAAARHEFSSHAGDVLLDYLALVDPETMAPHETGTEEPALLAIAARVGNTRLLDNAVIQWRPTPPPGSSPTLENE
ncbi:MAG TPA: pantoate--beta-alanine ligase [Beutenbergiaceae bacterium]|nr:pantoate--beta-alanine ligase [Beutenbergiaceae bacterium]